MTKKVEGNSQSGSGERSRHQIRLPGFISDEEIGLGDAIKRTASYFGVTACGGCEQRRLVLNRWMVFTNGPHG